jgi:hypothetical protein
VGRRGCRRQCVQRLDGVEECVGSGARSRRGNFAFMEMTNRPGTLLIPAAQPVPATLLLSQRRRFGGIGRHPPEVFNLPVGRPLFCRGQADYSRHAVVPHALVHLAFFLDKPHVTETGERPLEHLPGI